MSTIDDSVVARFWRKVKKTEGCWRWTGETNGKGYGRIVQERNHKAKNFLAHRVSWIIHYGSIPDGLCVCHKCDIRSCVNPDHLFLGTVKDNAQDMVRKNRNAVFLGERCGSSKCNDSQVIQMREEYANGTIIAKIAKEYNLSFRATAKIVRGETWKHLLARPTALGIQPRGITPKEGV